MKLPRYDFGGPAQDLESPGHAAVGAALEGLGRVVEEGLTAYGQEMVKTQTQEAHLDLSQRLNTLEQEIQTRQAIPVEEAKARLGDSFDQLPEALRKTPEVEVVDPATGQRVKKQADIPMWAIAGELFDRDAEQALVASSQKISTGGWAAEYQRAARGDMIQRRGRLMGQQLQAMHQYQVDARVRQILSYAETGDYGPQESDNDLGMAGAALNGSVDLLGTEMVGKLREQVKEIKQTKPVWDAMRMVQIPAYRPEGLAQLNAALASLGDPRRWTSISPEEQAKLSHQVRAAIDSVKDLVDKQAGAQLAFEIANAHIDARNPLRVNAAEAYGDLNDRLKAGTIDMATFTSANRILGDHIDDRNDGARQALGDIAGQAMDQFMAIGSDGQPRLSFSNVQQETINQLRTFGKDGQEVLESLIRWDQSNESHQRNMRQLPTQEQDARALAIERAVRRTPDVFRKMPTADLVDILVGKGEVPGEPDAPPVALSSRDLPRVRDLLGANAGAPGSVRVLSAEALAQDEFLDAFGLRRKSSKGWTSKQRADYRSVTDEISRWVTQEKAAGREPTDDQIRAHLRAQGGPLERLTREKGIFGGEKGPRTPLERGDWKPPSAAEGSWGAAGSSPREPPKGKVRVKGPNGSAGYAAEQGLDEWLKAHPGWSRDG